MRYVNYIPGLWEEWKTDMVAGLIVLFLEKNTCSFPKHLMNGPQEEIKTRSESLSGLKAAWSEILTALV